MIAIAACILVISALHDLAFRTVPNWASGVLLAAGVTRHILDHQLLYSLASVAILFVAAALCWRRGLMGGGDVKLLATAGSLLPAGTRFDYILLVALAGGVLALLYLVLQSLIRTTSHRKPSGLIGRIVKAERWRIARRGPLPYASAIAAGALCTLAVR
jgi:prepilin peptidase CpaA